MITSQTGSASAVNYAYDALSRLAASSASGSTPAAGYLYQGTSISLVKETVSNTLFASSPFGPLARKSGSTTAYFLKDLHGDVVGLSQAGATSNLAATTFDPWGEVKGSAGTGTSLGFQGQITDKATGMTKTATRFYDPSMGRFTAQDVLFGSATDANSLNQYAYAGDSPVGSSDLSGLKKCSIFVRKCGVTEFEDGDGDPNTGGGNGNGNGTSGQGSEGTGTETGGTGDTSQVTQEELGSVLIIPSGIRDPDSWSYDHSSAGWSGWVHGGQFFPGAGSANFHDMGDTWVVVSADGDSIVVTTHVELIVVAAGGTGTIGLIVDMDTVSGRNYAMARFDPCAANGCMRAPRDPEPSLEASYRVRVPAKDFPTSVNFHYRLGVTTGDSIDFPSADSGWPGSNSKGVGGSTGSLYGNTSSVGLEA